MARIRIENLPKDRQFSEQEMRAIRGGMFGALPPTMFVGGGGSPSQGSLQSLSSLGQMRRMQNVANQFMGVSIAQRRHHDGLMAMIRGIR